MEIKDLETASYLERFRQKMKGYTAEHDQQHAESQLLMAAACYLNPSLYPSLWPWDESYYKPVNEESDVIKALALIKAEVERIYMKYGKEVAKAD